MESKRKLERIRCVFLVKEIFNYIKDKNYKFKLFKYSKLFQKKIGIDLIDYQEKYIIQLGINFEDYLTFKGNENENFIKDILTIRLNSNLMNYVNLYMNDIQKIAIRHFEKKLNFLENKKQTIEIYSPFFEALSQSKLFEFFTISISLSRIAKFNLKNDYISIFNKMNIFNSNYSSINMDFENNNDINDLKFFNINFGQIKNLNIFQEFGTSSINYNNFLNTLFSFNNFGNNLIVLNIIFLPIVFIDGNEVTDYIDPDAFEIVNNFKSLRKLILVGFRFTKLFNLKLYNLEELSLHYCNNICFTNNEYNNLKYLHLSFNQNITSKQQLRIPELEECILLNKEEDLSEIDFNINYNSIIDFSSTKKMKILKVPINDFVLTKNFNSLESVILNSSKDISKETEIKMLEKILSIKNLDFISFNLFKININEILKIKGQNSYVTKINIYYNYEN